MLWSAHTANRPDTNAEVERMKKENQRLTIKGVAADLKISHSSKHQIIYDVLQYRKLFVNTTTAHPFPHMKDHREHVT